MKGARRFSKYLREQLRQKEFREAFEKEEVYANLAIQISKLRQEEGVTQEHLARLLHTTQQTVSRIEDPFNRSLSLSTLLKLAKVFKRGLRIQFV